MTAPNLLIGAVSNRLGAAPEKPTPERDSLSTVPMGFKELLSRLPPPPNDGTPYKS